MVCSCRFRDYIQEVIEQIAFVAREDKHIDKRSGVSQRLPICAIENVISNAERRRASGCKYGRCRGSATCLRRCPSITGKLELEYEGEMKGADHGGARVDSHRVAKSLTLIFTAST